MVTDGDAVGNDPGQPPGMTGLQLRSAGFLWPARADQGPMLHGGMVIGPEFKALIFSGLANRRS